MVLNSVSGRLNAVDNLRIKMHLSESIDKYPYSDLRAEVEVRQDPSLAHLVSKLLCLMGLNFRVLEGLSLFQKDVVSDIPRTNFELEEFLKAPPKDALRATTVLKWSTYKFQKLHRELATS